MINSLTAIEWTRVRAFCRDKRPDEITPNALYRAARGLKAGSRNTNMVTDSIMLDAVRMWCVKPEPPKEKPVPKHLYITVTGPAMSGKSTVVEVIAQALARAGLKCDVNYGDDGQPTSPLSRRIDAMKIAAPNITINQRQTQREPSKD